MNKIQKELTNFSLLLTLTLLLLACACPDCDDYNYKLDGIYDEMTGFAFLLIDNGTAYCVSSGTVKTGDVSIPAYFNGLPVKKIGSWHDNNTGFSTNAFYKSNISTVHIPETITTIENMAFEGCTNLVAVSFAPGSQLQAIGWKTFSGCINLTSITIPARVTSIDSAAFSKNTSLATVSFSSGSRLETINNEAFYECISLNSIAITASVAAIGRNVFSLCKNLKVITVGAGNTHFAAEGGILYNKDKTKLLAYPAANGNIIIPQGVKTIGESAFFSTSLTGIMIPATVASIGEAAFYNTGITRITIPAGVKSIESLTFSGCESLANITIPDTVTVIGNAAFSYCKGLVSIVIPDSTTKIGNGAFGSCINLGNIKIPNSVISVGSSAFSSWTSLQTINIFGHKDQASADNSWGAEWRSGCYAQINYHE